MSGDDASAKNKFTKQEVRLIGELVAELVLRKGIDNKLLFLVE